MQISEMGVIHVDPPPFPAVHRPRIASFATRVIFLVTVLNACIIVWLWGYDGGVAAVHGWGDACTSIGRVTGLLSAYLALLQVLLLARLPFLEQRIGFDHLTVWHRLNGKLCLVLVLGHVVFITIGYASMDQVAVPAEVSRLLSSYPGMVAATAGTLLMLAVVITSLVIVRRRLRYELWYFVHLSVYAAIALAWVHQIPTGNELTANAAAAAYWTALYILTFALLVAFRLLLPLVRIAWHGLHVESISQEAPGVVSVRITGRHLSQLHARGGQFFLWRFLTPADWWQAHPFSLSAAPDGRSLRITVKAVGDFTRRIGEIRPGTAILAEGPFGVFTLAARRCDHLLFIAGGIGITPIRAMIEEAQGDVVLLYRAVRDGELVFREELDTLAAQRGFQVHYLVGDHTTEEGKRLLTAAHLNELVPDIANRDVFLCGPPAMVQVLDRQVRTAGVPPHHVHTERFAL